MREEVATTYSESSQGKRMPTIDFPYSTTEQLDALFELQEIADAELRAANLGAIDGNEIGDGVFTLFLDPRRGKKTESIGAIEALATERGLKPNPPGR